MCMHVVVIASGTWTDRRSTRSSHDDTRATHTTPTTPAMHGSKKQAGNVIITHAWDQRPWPAQKQVKEYGNP